MIRQAFVAATLAAAGLALAACGSGTPTARPTKTITITASPATPAASAAATTQPASAAGAAAGCLTRYLYGSIGLTQGTAGAIEVTIVFKNLDNVSCTLYGFPGVALASGTPVTDVGQPSTESPTTARELVTLAPGGFAYATLQVSDAGNYPASACTQVATDWLAVIPPNQTVPLYIPYNSTGCQGSASLLTVTAVRPGNGG
jgi:Protein of unknown function (DUF4232)